jgi:LysR family hydrogen peroxide-inducible transcriptional activator
MTLQELRYLVAIAESGHFVRAAETCHVGQPTLSTQLKKLEDYLGVTLFERNKHHLRPTPIGEEIIKRARLALHVVDEMRSLARQGSDAIGEPLRMGVIPTLGPYLVPSLLPTLRQTLPRLRLSLREDLTNNLLQRLRHWELDALLVALPIQDADIEVLEVFREPFVVALPSDHPLGRKSRIARRELGDERMLLLEEGNCLRRQTQAICGSAANAPSDDLEATSLETLRQLVAAGVGVALLPALATLPGFGSTLNGSVQVRPFAPPVPTRTIAMVWRRSYARAATIRTVAEVIRTNMSSQGGEWCCQPEGTSEELRSTA